MASQGKYAVHHNCGSCVSGQHPVVTTVCGKCKGCGENTSSRSHIYCGDCARKRDCCNFCGKPRNEKGSPLPNDGPRLRSPSKRKPRVRSF